MNKTSNLIWGVTISAAQNEGASDKGGKGISIWDKFTKKRGKIKDGSNGSRPIVVFMQIFLLI